MRVPVPPDVAAKALFYSDRTCCVCRSRGKPVQLHHIDGDHSNSIYENLAVLCLDCHNETQLQGGFHRKLDAEQVRLYREDWLEVVSRERAARLSKGSVSTDKPDIGLITTITEVLREAGEYQLLAIYYDGFGNKELRDKYIELAIERGTDPFSEIYLRSAQDRPDLLNQEMIDKQIAKMEMHEDWSQLGRLYRDLNRTREAVRCYCKTVLRALEEGRVFSAAFYAKELCREKLYVPLFEQAYAESAKQNDLWWEVRALQELGWDSELKELLNSRREEIEKGSNYMLQIALYSANDERDKLREAYKAMYSNPRIARSPTKPASEDQAPDSPIDMTEPAE